MWLRRAHRVIETHTSALEKPTIEVSLGLRLGRCMHMQRYQRAWQVIGEASVVAAYLGMVKDESNKVKKPQDTARDH